MTTHDKYAQGTPCWADLQTTDTDGAKAFYGGLFGWTFDDQPTPQGATYSMGRIDGRSVAAIAPQTTEMAAQGVPPTWNVYLAVDDVDATTAAVAEAGGTVAMAPSWTPAGCPSSPTPRAPSSGSGRPAGTSARS